MEFVQIIPAPKNLFLQFEGVEGEVVENPALCLALTKSGEVVFLDTDSDGLIHVAEEISNFKGIEWR